MGTKTPALKKLDRPAGLARIDEILSAVAADAESLFAFAEFSKGKPLPEPFLTLTELKTAEWKMLGTKNATELPKSGELPLAMAGRTFDLKTKADWLKLYREWVGVSHSERTKTGTTSIKGIDVLDNFRPCHIISHDLSTASAQNIKDAFRRLAKEHHPDVGGDPRVMERLHTMRNSLLAFL